MEQVLALAKVGLAAAQIYLDGACYSACRYERMGEEGYWSRTHQSCACLTYMTPEDSFFAMKIGPTYGQKEVILQKERDPEPEAESPSFKLDYDY